MPGALAIPDPAQPLSRPLLVLAVLAVLSSFFFALGRSPLFDVDEGAFSQATVEMFQRGDFLSTYLNGAPRYDKPILVYWLQAASVALFGVNEFAFRLPSALCAALWAVLTFLFARHRYGSNTALVSVVIMATSLGVYIIARAATADALLNMLIAASMFGTWLHLGSGRRAWLYATFASIGLGFLAKGPVAILIPFAVSLTFCLLRRDLKTWVRAVSDWRGLLLFAAIALPWYIFILHRDGWAFVQGFFFKHNLSRFSGPLQGHAGSLLYYFPVLVIGTLPFTAFLIRVVQRVRTAWQDDLQCYLLIWFGFVFVFFSFSGTKLPHYLLYGMTGLFILMAVYGPEVKSRFWVLLPPLLFYLFVLALPFSVERLIPLVPDAYYRDALADVEQQFGPGYYVYAVAAALLIIYFIAENRFALTGKLVVAAITGVIALSAFLVPIGAQVQQAPIKEAALLARARGYPVIMWRLNAPSFSVYYGQPTPTRDPAPGDIVITKAKRLVELPNFGTEVLYAKRGIVLVRVTG